MQYDNFLIKLYKNRVDPQKPPRYQAQILTPDSADGGRFDLPLSDDTLTYLFAQSAKLREYAALGPDGWSELGYVAIDETVYAVTERICGGLPLTVQADIQRLLHQALHRNRGLRLGLLIDEQAAELGGLPWEMLWHREWVGGYLAQSPYAPITRLVETNIPPRGSGSSPPLLLRSNNGDRFLLGTTPPLTAGGRVLIVVVGATADQEVAGARAEAIALGELLAAMGTRVRILEPPATLAALAAELTAAPYHVIHFLVHGAIDAGSSLPYLVFDLPPAELSDESRSLDLSDKVTAPRLYTLLQGHPTLELLVFHTCQSAASPLIHGLSPPLLPTSPEPSGRASRISSLGEQMVATTAVPVVAMQFDILAPAAGPPAQTWAQAFYRHLLSQGTVEEAVAAVRQALTIDGDPVLWAAPVLYLPLYWTPPPEPLYHRLDRWIYGGIASTMEYEGQPWLEIMLLGGLALAAGQLLQPLLTLPANPADGVGIMRGAFGLILATTILPLLLAGCALVLEARRQSALRHLPGRRQIVLLLVSFTGAGLGILTVLFLGGILGALLYAGGLLNSALAPLLSLSIVAGCVVQGLIFAGRLIRVQESISDQQGATRTDVFLAAGPPIVGIASVVFLEEFYSWLLAENRVLAILALALIAFPLWILRRPPPTRRS